MFKKPSTTASNAGLCAEPWRVLIVDDEPEVHTVTRLALSDCQHLGRGIEFVSAHSAAQARELLGTLDNVALAFIDVVMETDTAGLDLVNYIRSDLGNKMARIVLRTGQPGMAPERTVIQTFDINDYICKTQSSSGKLFTVALTALRSYNDLMTLARSHRQLERYRDGLEMVITASSNLFELRSLRQFAGGLLKQVSALLTGSGESMMVRSNGVTVVQRDDGFEVLAASGNFESGEPLPAPVLERLRACLASQQSQIDGEVFVGHFATKSGIVNLLYIDGIRTGDMLDLKLLDVFSKNISIALENLHLDREIFDTQSEIIATLGDIVETRSKEAGNHISRVRHLARLIAELGGLDEAQTDLIYMASPMHDIGKVAIPDSILLKPGPLEPDEWRHMQRHAEIGQQLLGNSPRPLLQAAATIAGQHHEKYDGSGYPLGLAGDGIHIFGRIVALVDVFDALMNRRCYKPAWPLEKVVELLQRERGRHFDPHLVDVMLSNLDQVMAVVKAFPDTSLADSEEPEGTAPEAETSTA